MNPISSVGAFGFRATPHAESGSSETLFSTFWDVEGQLERSIL
jgi:hypothetical protein